MKDITDGSFDVNKALGELSAFQFVDISPTLLEQKPVQPKLLSTLIGRGANTEYNITNSFIFDTNVESVTLPSGKSYSGFGPDLTKDVDKQYTYSIPSFGLRFNISPADYINRRIPGTDQMQTEAYCIAKLNKKAQISWELFDELAIAQLLTADTNIVRTGPFSEYNFYTELTGGARGAATAVELDDANADHIGIMRTAKKTLLQNAARAGVSVSQIVCICGDTFFEGRFDIEQNTSLNRELRSIRDYASQEVDQVTIDGWNYDAFKGAQDGILYVNYGSEIIAGTNLIADTKAYLMPMSSDMLLKSYAPARDRDNANREAKVFYAWSNIDNRQGVTVFQESNILYMNRHPELIIHLINT